MRHQVKKRYLRRDSAHRRALLRNLVTSFIDKERIRTTVAKAKAAKPIAEKMITLAKRNTLHARRQALAYIFQESVVKKLFDVVGPRFTERPGGYYPDREAGPQGGRRRPDGHSGDDRLRVQEEDQEEKGRKGERGQEDSFGQGQKIGAGGLFFWPPRALVDRLPVWVLKPRDLNDGLFVSRRVDELFIADHHPHVLDLVLGLAEENEVAGPVPVRQEPRRGRFSSSGYRHP